MTDSGFVDSAPPKSSKTLTVPPELQELLRQHVGQWYLLEHREDHSSRSTLSKPRYLGEDFEWRSHRKDGVLRYYVRYVGMNIVNLPVPDMQVAFAAFFALVFIGIALSLLVWVAMDWYENR